MKILLVLTMVSGKTLYEKLFKKNIGLGVQVSRFQTREKTQLKSYRHTKVKKKCVEMCKVIHLNLRTKLKLTTSRKTS